jgi:hypothetical protein
MAGGILGWLWDSQGLWVEMDMIWSDEGMVKAKPKRWGGAS